jgi:hypothetical protein
VIALVTAARAHSGLVWGEYKQRGVLDAGRLWESHRHGGVTEILRRIDTSKGTVFLCAGSTAASPGGLTYEHLEREYRPYRRNQGVM